MIYLDEIRLNLAEAKTAFGQLPQQMQQSHNWSDWFAEFMVKSGMQIKPDELATLLREADNSYNVEHEQYPWLDYMARHIDQAVNK